MLDTCINVEPLGQRVPQSELSSLSRIITSLPSASFPVSIRGVSPSILRVLSDERSDGHRFVYAREFSVDVFLHCYRVAHQEIFGLLEVTTMVDFLMLRLRGASVFHDRHVFQLFSWLIRVLKRCGCLSSSDAQSSREEFATCVVDATSRHRESE